MRNPTRSLIALLAVVIVLGVVTAAPASAAIINGVQSGTTTMSSSSASVTATLGRTVDATRAFVTCTYRNDDDLATRRVSCNLASDGTGVVLTQNVADNGTIVRWNVADFQSGVSVQRGTATFASGETQPGGATVTLAAVEMAKTFVLVTDRPNVPTGSPALSHTIDEQWTIRGRLTSSTTLELMRAETGIEAAADWQVVTMEGASVQRGTACIGGSGTCTGSDGQFTTFNLATAVDTSKSFIVVSRMGRGSIGGIEWKHIVGADFTSYGTSVTGVRLGRQAADTAAGNEVDVAWAVVTLSDGSSVRRGTTGSLGNLSGGTSTLTSSPAFTAVDTTRSLPFVTLAAGSGNNTDDGRETQWTATLNATTFTFERGVGSNRPTAFGWQAVEFFRCVDHPVCSVSAKTGSGTATVYWSPIYNSACTGIQCHVLVLRQPTAVTATPTDGTAYTAGQTIGSATVAYSGTGTPSPAGSAYPTEFTESGLANGTSYCYRVYYKSGAADTTYTASTSADCSAAGEVVARPAAGNTLWSYAVNGGSALNAPIAGFGQVFAATNGAKIASLDSSTGANLAVFARTHGAVQSYVSWFPVSTSTTDETVVAADQSGYVYAINALDGTVRWSKKLGADGFQAAVSVQLNHTYFTTDAWRAAYAASPYFYTGDVVFVATRNTSDTLNEVFALRATDGTQLWKYTPATSMDKVLAQPYVDYQRNRLYIAGLAGFDGSQLSLRVIDSTDGTEIACDACAALGDIETAPSQSFDYTTLYVGTKAGMIHAIALDTLQSKWTSPFSTAGKRVKSLIWEDWDTAGKLYFVAEGPTADEVWSIQDDGAQATTVFTRTPIAAGRLAQPVIGDSSTYPYMWIGGSDGKLYQLRLSDGQSLTEAGAPQAAFTVGDGTKTLGDVSTDDVTGVYVGTSGGTFYKIQLPLP